MVFRPYGFSTCVASAGYRRRNYCVLVVSGWLRLVPEEYRVLGDDPRVQRGRGKPAPDIYLIALQTINSRLPEGFPKIAPDECLIFEDSVPGVEAGRRAGMRVVWVPHPGLFAELKGREKEVLAGRMGLVKIGNEEQLGEIDDGWGEYLPSLEHFPYGKFGIEVSLVKQCGRLWPTAILAFLRLASGKVFMSVRGKGKLRGYPIQLSPPPSIGTSST
jgi:Haloacid dehalogenase-like hydrolase